MEEILSRHLYKSKFLCIFVRFSYQHTNFQYEYRTNRIRKNGA